MDSVKEYKENNLCKTSVVKKLSIYADLIINKGETAKAFLESIEPYENIFQKADTILELGAGSGWASCLIKDIFKKRVLCSDINEDVLTKIKYWEDIFKVKLDEKIVCDSCNIPINDATIDVVFCFQAAHHFKYYYETLLEIHRILRSNGYCIFLHEPSCRKYIYKIAYKRVNKKRPGAGEDVLIFMEIAALAKKIGFQDLKIKFRPSLINKRLVPMIYNYFLSKIKILQKILPSSTDYLFNKKEF